MENASKALIIAGAILIAILLISVAVIIMNSTGSMQDRVGKTADTMEIQTFNSNFTSYEGTNISASQVRALLSLIRSSNAANGVADTSADNAESTEKYVFLDSGSGVTSTTQVNSNKTYTVEVTGYCKGYVNKIKITETTATPST